ncbi:hypothetical protein [Novipirellula artificiosorum]|uniref:Uncharacterized protein n=1 Tax=Novipirellula artificiosorum TaxID=2528016 RepID=A0A5C6DSK1_9BACT|nr:hypothetical protein [Novipirellula artificiosorum]TWU39255.1 hypothetical protein Poly41_20770 [Novipirellula artificiosorum]
MNRFFWLTLLVASTTLCTPQLSHAQFETLVRHLPEGANTLVLFNMEKILASPLAVQRKWAENQENMFESGILFIPPQTQQLVMASETDFELMQPHWNASVVNLSDEPSMLTVSERYDGSIDEIGGQEAAVLSNNTYVVKFGKFIAGMMYPADRQKAARWVEEAYANTGRKPLGEYLQQAEGYADNNKTPIIMAMDFENLLSKTLIRQRLDGMKSLQGQKVDLDQLAATLATIRGAMLGINVTDRVFGAIKIDFGQDVTFMEPYAKALLLESLGHHGAMIQEFNDWKLEVTGKEILLKGSLQQSGVQRLFSLLDTPQSLHAMVSSASSSTGSDPASKQELVAQATKQYFHAIQLLVTDLSNEDEKHDTYTTGLEAMWYQRYAAKIDALPILHVDPVMIKFATQVSATLRQSQNAMRSVGIQTASQVLSAPDAQVYNYRTATGPWGGYGYRYAYNPRASARATATQDMDIAQQAKIKGYATANNLMQQITVAMADMRREMTEKYNVEF